jgi:hypothetical protein
MTKNQTTEKHGQGHPDSAPDPGFAISDCVSFAIEEAEIEAQHAENKKTKPHPQPC